MQSGDFLYNRTGAQNCKDSRTYSKTFGVTIAERVKVGTFGNVLSKWPIIS